MAIGRIRFYKTFLGVFGVILVAVSLGGISRVEAVPGGLTYQDVARDVMSPACPGRLLIDCTSGEADQLRELIRQKIAQGHTKTQIIDDLVDRYGIEILASPPKEGFYLTAWVLPFLAILYGVLMLFLAVRALSRRKPAHPQAEGAGEENRPADDPYRKKLEEELKEFEY